MHPEGGVSSDWCSQHHQDKREEIFSQQNIHINILPTEQCWQQSVSFDNNLNSTKYMNKTYEPYCCKKHYLLVKVL